MVSEEKRNKQKALKFVILTVIAGVIMFFFGIPALAKFTGFVAELVKSDKPITQNDKTPPAPPQIESTPEFTNQEILKIIGKSEEGAVIKLVFNGKEDEVVTNTNGEFSKNLDLQKGENTLVASAKDLAGNESQKTKNFTITFDSDEPDLTINSPSGGTSFFGSRQRQVDIKGSVDDKDTKVTINDRFVAVEDSGDFQFTTTLNEGENKFTIKAEDFAGNVSQSELSLNFTL
ncbi:MAG: Ig-like domain-containing protein [Patescibacteria group bacterium]